jgi:hypothetical protein
LCLLGCSEPMDIAAQGRSEALQTMFEPLRQGPISHKLWPLHSLHLQRMLRTGFHHL